MSLTEELVEAFFVLGAYFPEVVILFNDDDQLLLGKEKGGGGSCFQLPFVQDPGCYRNNVVSRFQPEIFSRFCWSYVDDSCNGFQVYFYSFYSCYSCYYFSIFIIINSIFS